MAKGNKKGKKGKEDKKSKKGKKSKSIVIDDKEPDPNIICSEGQFTLPNEDIYIGEFCAHRQGIIWREGNGIYKTKDGQEYEGQWHNDKLLEGSPVEIRYPEDHTFVGLLNRDKYNGPGTYYCSEVKISCNFENNKPHGMISLIDPKGEVYAGIARENSATLHPTNVLFDHINPMRGILYDEAMLDVTDVESAITCAMSDIFIKDDEPWNTNITWKDIVFAKSKKTNANMEFLASDWYKDWLEFKKTKERIKSGLPSNEEHSQTSTADDEQWLQQYQCYKQIRNKHTLSKEPVKEEPDLLSVFKSTAYEKSCPAVRIMYPSSDWDTFNSAVGSEARIRDGENAVQWEHIRSSEQVVKKFSELLTDKQTEKQTLEKVRKRPADSKPASRRKCLNRKNFGGGTTSLLNMVNNFFDNTPICTQYYNTITFNRHNS